MIDVAEASFQLGIGRTHLYRLRTRFLKERSKFAATLSGGDHWPDWPPEAVAFLKKFLPLQKPPSFQLVADELETRFGFKRHRESVAAFARSHFSNLICQPEPRPKARRRWERSRIDELWQHDSSIHQGWPATAKQTLLLTVDDHSRKLLGAVFVPTDTTWNHFEHFRRLFLRHCLPLVVYTDGLSLFGHDSMADDRDPCSEFQRAFSALGVTHLVAPSPQAKGKIDFLGQSWHIAPTQRSSVTRIHHPLRQFWAVTQPPSPPRNNWPEILGKYSL